jgi:mercuric ion binding protein
MFLKERSFAVSNRKFCILTLSLALLGPSAWAASKTVTLKVPGMTCPTCPITVKKALNKVDGVSKVEVRYEKKEAVVTFDDAKTDTKALIKATTDAGFPSEEQK